MKTSKKNIVAFAMAIFCLWIVVTPTTWNSPFLQSNQAYLQNCSKETLWCLAGIGVIKGASDVIEGSTIGVNFGVKGDLEVGDMAQPALDVVTVIWNTMLIIASYVTILQLLMQITPFISYWLALAFLAFYLAMLIWYAIKRRSLRSAFLFDTSRPMHFLCVIILCIQVLLPITLQINAFISQHTLSNIREEQANNLESIKINFNTISQRLQMDKSEFFDGDFWKESSSLLLINAQKLSQYAINAIAICIVEGFIIPLASLLCLAWFSKNYLFH